MWTPIVHIDLSQRPLVQVRHLAETSECATFVADEKFSFFHDHFAVTSSKTK